MTKALIGRAWTQGVLPTSNNALSIRIGAKVHKGFFDVGANTFRLWTRNGLKTVLPQQVDAWAVN